MSSPLGFVFTLMLIHNEVSGPKKMSNCCDVWDSCITILLRRHHCTVGQRWWRNMGNQKTDGCSCAVARLPHRDTVANWARAQLATQKQETLPTKQRRQQCGKIAGHYGWCCYVKSKRLAEPVLRRQSCRVAWLVGILQPMLPTSALPDAHLLQPPLLNPSKHVLVPFFRLS